MTDAPRERAITAAFQTGRSVFADAEGNLRFVDGEREPLPDDVGVPKMELPEARTRRSTWWSWLRGILKTRAPS